METNRFFMLLNTRIELLRVLRIDICLVEIILSNDLEWHLCRELSLSKALARDGRRSPCHGRICGLQPSNSIPAADCRQNKEFRLRATKSRRTPVKSAFSDPSVNAPSETDEKSRVLMDLGLCFDGNMFLLGRACFDGDDFLGRE